MPFVVSSSTLSASLLVQHLSRALPAAYARTFRAQGNRISVGRPVIPRSSVGAVDARGHEVGLWHRSIITAAESDEWMVVSAEQVSNVAHDVSVRPVSALWPDLPPNAVVVDGAGDAVASPMRFPPTVGAEAAGRTLPSEAQAQRLGYPGMRIRGERGLIIVSTRVRVFTREATEQQGSARRPARTHQHSPRDIANTFLHEAAAHAGLASANLPFGHGDAVVDAIATQVDELFGPNVANLPSTPTARPVP